MRGSGRGEHDGHDISDGALWLCLPLAGEPQDRPVRAAGDAHAPAPRTGKGKIAGDRDTDSPQTRVCWQSLEIADALVISPRQLYLTAKAVGTTNLTLWEENDHVFAIYDLVISPGPIEVEREIPEILPREDIRVTATNDVITLFGRISSAAKLSQALDSGQRLCP